MTQERSGLEGDFDTISLLGMLWWLHHTKRTVTMRIETAGKPAWVFFREGNLYRCDWGTLSGRRALFALAPMRAGSFWLSRRLAFARSDNIETPTRELLRACVAVKDSYEVEARVPAQAA